MFVHLRTKPHRHIIRKRFKLRYSATPVGQWTLCTNQLGDARSCCSLNVLNVLNDFNRELLCAEIGIAAHKPGDASARPSD
jgi:hypothetical protein